jgi:hypothetical protein
MATSHLRQFIGTATARAPGTDTLPGHGCRCGLCTGWCLLPGMTPRHDASFRSGMRMCRINIPDGRLRTRGRAAPDCIRTSCPRTA